MNQKITAAEGRFMDLVAKLPCLVCKRIGFALDQRAEVHHLATGSSRQNNWLVAPLCAEHHRGGSGLHGMGARAFCSLYRVPHETEYGLLAWLHEDLEAALNLRRIESRAARA